MIELFGLVAFGYVLCLTAWIGRNMFERTGSSKVAISSQDGEDGPLGSVVHRVPASLLAPPQWVLIGALGVAAFGLLSIFVL